MLTKEQVIHKIELHKDKIRSFGVKSIALFGSYARDEATEKSDLDFLVEFEEMRGSFQDFVHLLHFLEDTFGKKIDLVEPHLVREELKESILGGKIFEATI